MFSAQICNNGEGKIAYEKTVSSLNNRFKRLDEIAVNATPEHGYEILQKSELPLKVLEGCFQKCQDDKLGKLSSCKKFDFLPGKRINSSDSDTLLSIYEPSKCIFYNVSNGNLDMTDLKDIPKESPILEFKEVCLSGMFSFLFFAFSFNIIFFTNQPKKFKKSVQIVRISLKPYPVIV